MFFGHSLGIITVLCACIHNIRYTCPRQGMYILGTNSSTNGQLIRYPTHIEPVR